MDIDVVIPAYNASKYIFATLESVLKQTLLPKNIIVVNDGSTDDTAEIVAGLMAGKYASRLKLISQDNAGLSSARNAGIRASEAPLIAFVDSDDIWAPDKLAKQLEVFLRGNNDLGLVYSGYQLIDSSGDVINDHGFDLSVGFRGRVYERLLSGNYISGSGSAVIVRSKCFDKVGLFDEDLSSCEDWDMWLRISRFYEVDYVDDCLVYIRRHNRSMQSDFRRMLDGQLLFLNKRFCEGVLNSGAFKEFRLCLIRHRVSARSLCGFSKCDRFVLFKVGRFAVFVERVKIAFFVQIRRLLLPNLLERVFNKVFRHVF